MNGKLGIMDLSTGDVFWAETLEEANRIRQMLNLLNKEHKIIYPRKESDVKENL